MLNFVRVAGGVEDEDAVDEDEDEDEVVVTMMMDCQRWIEGN